MAEELGNSFPDEFEYFRAECTDADGDGVVTPSELLAYMGQLDLEEKEGESLDA